MIIVTQGLRIKTSCRYLKFTQSKYLNIYEDNALSCLFIEFPSRLSSDRIVDKHIEVLSPCKLHETDYIKLTNTTFILNGIRFIKTIQSDYVINQYIVKSIPKFIMKYDEFHCEILIPKILEYRLDKYVELISHNPYIILQDKSKFIGFSNFYSVNISNKDINLISNNKFEFNTKKSYTAYLLTPIDILQSFKNRMTKLVTEYGLQYVRYPIDEKCNIENRIVWKFTDTDKHISHKLPDYPLRYSVLHQSHVDFTLTTPNLTIYDDFKTKYQNLDLISNLTTFITKDKLGVPWISNVWWSPISTSFNQDYSVDSQSNIAQELSFSCDIQYYVVYDEMYTNILSIIVSMLDHKDNLIDIIQI